MSPEKFKFLSFIFAAGFTKVSFLFADAVGAASSEPGFYKMLMDQTGWGACVILLSMAVINLWKDNQKIRDQANIRNDQMYAKFLEALDQHKQDRTAEKDSFIDQVKSLIESVQKK